MMEFDLIERIRRRVPARTDVVLGIGDDAAIVQVPADRQLVIATDTLNAGVHFPAATAPTDIGWKALAVNLSDLAAMGAQPAWCTLSLSVPHSNAAWLDGFHDGFLEISALHGVALVGGDTTSGPMSICVTVHGLVAPGEALRRDAARVGDDVWVSGTLGDAAAALRRLLPGPGEECAPLPCALRARLDRPTPRVGLGIALAGLANACIDVSDGLLADLGHICSASGVAGVVQLADLPTSPEMRSAYSAGERAVLQATGGDDYELCFTAPRSRRDKIEQLAVHAGTALTRIGHIHAGSGISARSADGESWLPASAGYQHFAG
ncbi:MAG: thiamine-phosphate kinase [Proteobacteria bacterium]|nr:thiamine-phosphate kinase [Pseudomonadota bacterium]